MKIKAHNKKVVLCKSFDGSFFIRLYNNDSSFVDFDILHNDLEITITDSNAVFIMTTDQNYIIEETY